MKKNKLANKGEIIIYKPKNGDIELKVKMEKESVWITQAQMALLFGTKRPAITKHLNNIFQSKELNKDSACSILEHTAADGKKYKTQFFNLDAIISVGYRVNSKEATQFRIWATKILKNYLTKGYAINSAKLKEEKDKLARLQTAIYFLQKKAAKKQLAGQEKELLNLLAGYSRSLTLLEKYDKEKLTPPKGTMPKYILTYENCLLVVESIKKDLMAKKEASEIFGIERGRTFESIISNLHQTYDKKQLYKSLEEKAANLLYLIIKDHPFSDGNKRIGSFIFVYFLDMNSYLYRANGEKRISDGALAALALLVAESAPKEKNQLIALIAQMIK